MSIVALNVESERQAGELRALRRMLDVARGGFSLGFAVCNSPALRSYLIGQVRKSFPDVEEVIIPPETVDVFGFVRANSRMINRTALFVTGLERSLPSSEANFSVLRSLNASRELWVANFACPVVFWVPEYVATLLSNFVDGGKNGQVGI